MANLTHIALLRGVNVSGQNRLAMAPLRQSMEALGLEQVQTYLQSGNLLFRPPERLSGQPPEYFSTAIQGRILRDFGHQLAVIILAPAELAQTVAENPFLKEPGLDPAWTRPGSTSPFWPSRPRRNG